MPSTLGALRVFAEAGILYAPGKAANASGVAISGLEISQNAQRLAWSTAEVDQRPQTIMRSIHTTCVEHGAGKGRDGAVSYADGANIAGFVKVADALITQGIV